MVEKDKPAIVNVDEHGLKKHDIKTSTVVFMIFCLVAAGAYGIEEMIPESGPGLTLVMLLILPFVWGLPFGLVASELGSVRPQEGGYYKWVQEAMGEFWGFQAGWWRTISIYLDNTSYVVLAGGYIANAMGFIEAGRISDQAIDHYGVCLGEFKRSQGGWLLKHNIIGIGYCCFCSRSCCRFYELESQSTCSFYA